MRVSELEPFLARLYRAGAANRQRLSVLCLGPPGVGKSMTVYALAQRLAREAGKEFVDYSDDVAEDCLRQPDKYFVLCDLRLTECEPSDLIGIPRTVNDATHYVPLLWARVMSRCAGILFLDELTNVQRPDVITASYKLVLDRKAGFTPFHKDVMVVAAGNAPEHSAVATMLPTPLVDRLLVLYIDPPTVDGWAKWMSRTYGDEWDRRAYAFLKRFEAEGYLLQVPRKVETLHNYPTPRSWTATSLLLHRGVGDDDALAGLLGGEVGQKFAAFCAVNIDVRELIAHPELFAQLDLDGRYMASVMLGTWLSKHKEHRRAFGLVDAMSRESREFLVIAAMSTKRAPLVRFLKVLFKYNPKYRDALTDVVTLKGELKA